MDWKPLLLVGIGGALGSMGRFGVAALAQAAAPGAVVPLGTLIVNVLGCFAIGCLGALVEVRASFGPEARAFLFAGVLGGFTTFSSFGYETLGLARGGELGRALANVLAQNGLGLAAAWLGYGLVRS
jgi:CrcB protein